MTVKNIQTKAIGGFLELELPLSINNKLSSMLSCGRSGLAWILKHIHCDKLYIPYYICPVVPELLTEKGIKFEYYHVNEFLMPEKIPSLLENEYFLYVNYFGIKDSACDRLSEQLGSKLILDLTQAFFYDVPSQIKSFTSARKFFGVPDGCTISGVTVAGISDLPRYNGAGNAGHLLLRQDGKLPEGYTEFVKHESTLGDMLQISELSENILQRIDCSSVENRRIENFSVLHDALGKINQLKDLTPCASLCYPLLLENGHEIKKELCENKIFVPTYWPNLDIREKLIATEKNFVDNLICLPMDQRYSSIDMEYIKNKLSKLF